MKTIKLLGAYLLLSMSVILTTSCEKEAIEAPIQNEIVKEDIAVQGKSILHKRYDANLSYEQAKTLWNKDINTFKAKNITRASVDKIFYTIGTKTGTGIDDETTGEVEIKVYFNTNGGVYDTGYVSLNREDYNDRQGGWDFYLMIYEHELNTLSSIGLRSSRIKLKGTDGWRLEKLNIEIDGDYQNVVGEGQSRLYQRIFKSLDNLNDNEWDIHYTGVMSNTGNVTF
ncbi:hypothetical protein [Aquimarina rhabdastrellae]